MRPWRSTAPPTQRLDVGAVAQVQRGAGVDRAAVGLDQADRLRCSVGVEVAADDRGALAGEQPGGHPAHSAADAGQQDDFAFQTTTSHGPSPFISSDVREPMQPQRRRGPGAGAALTCSSCTVLCRTAPVRSLAHPGADGAG